MKFQSFSFLMIALSISQIIFINNLDAQCQFTTNWGGATAPIDNTTAIMSTCNYAGEYGLIENIAAGNIYVVSSSYCNDYITIYDENLNIVEYGNAPVAFYATTSGDYQAHFAADDECATNDICRETGVHCISCGAVPGCTDIAADNYNPDADFGQCNCTYTVPDNDECANAIDLTGYINADGSCTSIHLSDYTGATNSEEETLPSLACVGGDPNPKDVWFSLTVPEHGAFTFDFIATPGFSSVMELYVGNCGDLIPYDPVNCQNTVSRSFEGLESATTVYLRVWDFGSDDNGNHEICIKRTPYCAFLNSPFGNNVPVESDLNWNAVEGAIGYALQIGTSPGGDDIMEFTDVGDVLYYDMDLLEEGTTYYVNLNAYNNIGISNSCQESSFTTACNSFSILADITNEICNGDYNGSIDVSIPTGSGEYTFNWNGSGNFDSEEEDIIGLTAGIYALTVTDEDNSCVATTFFVVSSNDPIETDYTSVNAGCIADGMIDLSVSGGAGGFEFEWSTGDTEEDLVNASAGFYDLTITDQAGCSRSIEEIEIQQSGLDVNVLEIQQIGCEVETGSIDLSPETGTGPYEYSWISNDGETTGSVTDIENEYSVSDLPEGVYEVLVVDAGGCETILTGLEIQRNDELLLSYSKTDISCFNEANGSITMVINTGVPPYQVLFSNGVSANISTETYELTSLDGGNYGVTITDGVGCVGIHTNMIIEEPEPLTLMVDEVNYPMCQGDEQGMIDVTVAGGTGPFSYQWNNGTAEEDLQQLGQGVYQVTITDGNACTISSPELLIIEPEAIALAIDGIQHVSCFGESNGSIFTKIIGGTAPYGITWNTGSVDDDLTGLAEGYYQATITDFNGCTSISPEIEVYGPDEALVVTVEEKNNISCFGFENGFIDLNVVGGVPPYDFQWSNGADDEDLETIKSGNYLVTVTDQNGCNYISPVFFIDEPSELTYRISSSPELQGESNGTATIEVEGGTPPYTILWDSNAGAQGTKTATELSSGTYVVYVQDANGCEFFAEVEVGLEIQTSNRESEIVESLRLFPNPSTGIATLQMDFKDQVNVQIEILDLQGRLINLFSKKSIQNKSFEIDLSNQANGVYLLKIVVDEQFVLNRRFVKHQ